MIHRLDTGRIQATVLNFSDRTVTDRMASEHLPPAASVTDMLTNNVLTDVDDEHACTISLQPYEGISLLIGPPSR
jgi:hypothetical protein